MLSGKAESHISFNSFGSIFDILFVMKEGVGESQVHRRHPRREVEERGIFSTEALHLLSPEHLGVEWYTLAFGPVQMYT